MTLEERMRLSYYRNVSVLDEEHAVIVVQHTETKALYLRKELDNFQIDIFKKLMTAPVPNMPRIVEAVEDAGKLIVIESYITGETLQHQLDTQGVFASDKARSICIQLCNIVGRLHAMNIIHRDIKPDNIILGDDGILKLLDLDAAKVYKQGESRDTQLIGTREYAAPEQYGFGASSPATDVYAIGVLLNVLVTGTYPRISLTSDPNLKAIIQKCTRMKPAERYPSALELRNALASGSANVSANKISADKSAPPQEAPVVSAPDYAPAPLAEGAALKGRRRFLPPGFRTMKAWKILVASAYYVFLAFLFYKMLTDKYEVSSQSDVFLAAVGMLILGLSIPVFLCNYLNIWKPFHIERRKTPFLRYLSAAVWEAVFFVAFLGLWKLLLTLLRNMGVI